jgi:hypothetical protein
MTDFGSLSKDEQEFTDFLYDAARRQKKLREEGWKRVIVLDGPYKGWRWIRELHDTIWEVKDAD